jgi:hypothetical protein
MLFMRAVSMVAERKIAVHAQYSITTGIPAVSEPHIELSPLMTDCVTMGSSMAFKMVYGQEFDIRRITVARALASRWCAAIVSQDLEFDFISVPLFVRPSNTWIVDARGSPVFLRSVVRSDAALV